MHISSRFAWLILSAFFLGLQGCGGQQALTVYTSVDRDYAEPIITAFQEAHPDLKVDVSYDSELTKTAGLYTSILKERENPQADVFWNSEIIRTIQLKQEGALQPYKSPSAQDIPDRYKDPEGYWTGFSGRLRVMVINTKADPVITESHSINPNPAAIDALWKQKYRGKIGMARPEFGTTAAHMAALYTKLGANQFTQIMRAIKENEIKVLPGNATVRDEVAGGTLVYGLTDTDDVFAALDEGKPVRMEYLNQFAGDTGTLLIPNTVAIIRDAPNLDFAKMFVDYMLSPAVEQKLAATRARQIPLRESVAKPEGVPDLSKIKVMDVDYSEVAKNLEPTLEIIRTLNSE